MIFPMVNTQPARSLHPHVSPASEKQLLQSFAQPRGGSCGSSLPSLVVLSWFSFPGVRMLLVTDLKAVHRVYEGRVRNCQALNFGAHRPPVQQALVHVSGGTGLCSEAWNENHPTR